MPTKTSHDRRTPAASRSPAACTASTGRIRTTGFARSTPPPSPSTWRPSAPTTTPRSGIRRPWRDLSPMRPSPGSRRPSAVSPLTATSGRTTPSAPPARSTARSAASRTVAGPDPAPGDELVLDIDGLRGGSTYVDLGLCELSPDERLLAYSVDLTGDEVYELRFRDLATGQDLPDTISRSYYSGAWSSAGDQFFYTVHDAAYRPFEVRRHVLGTDPAADVVVLAEPDEQFELTVEASRSGRLIVITSENRDTTEQWLIDPASPAAPPRCVEPRERGREYRVEHAPYTSTSDDSAAEGEAVDRLLIVTNHEAPEFRLMAAPTDSPGLGSWLPFLAYDPGQRLLQRRRVRELRRAVAASGHPAVPAGAGRGRTTAAAAGATDLRSPRAGREPALGCPLDRRGALLAHRAPGLDRRRHRDRRGDRTASRGGSGATTRPTTRRARPP